MIAAPQRLCGTWAGLSEVLKEKLIDAADWFAARSKRCAFRWASWSEWWSDFAESLETGDSISSIRKQREENDHDA